MAASLSIRVPNRCARERGVISTIFMGASSQTSNAQVQQRRAYQITGPGGATSPGVEHDPEKLASDLMGGGGRWFSEKRMLSTDGSPIERLGNQMPSRALVYHPTI